jgi:hypothetical protein
MFGFQHISKHIWNQWGNTFRPVIVFMEIFGFGDDNDYPSLKYEYIFSCMTQNNVFSPDRYTKHYDCELLELLVTFYLLSVWVFRLVTHTEIRDQTRVVMNKFACFLGAYATLRSAN